MPLQPRRVALLPSLVLCLVLALLGGQAATAVPTGPVGQARPVAPQSRSAVVWGPTSWVAGVGGYAVSGKLAGPSRTVQLQYKVKGGWRTLDKTRSRKRSFALAGGWEWYGAHRVRLLAPRAGGRPARVLGKQVLTVLTDYVPRGEASQNVPYGSAGRDLRFDPCRTIRWRWNSGSGAGDPLFGQVQTAIGLISRASGLTFKYVGTSTVVPVLSKKFERGTDLVVAFGHDADIPPLNGSTALGGIVASAPAKGAGPRSDRIVRAGVTVSIEKIFSSYYAQEQVSTSPTTLLVLMHELGHAMGLDHVTSPGADVEVMWSGSTYIAPWPDGLNYPRWGAGDLAGLAKLGAASSCLR